jgi:hypothetical protein
MLATRDARPSVYPMVAFRRGAGKGGATITRAPVLAIAGTTC